MRTSSQWQPFASDVDLNDIIACIPLAGGNAAHLRSGGAGVVTSVPDYRLNPNWLNVEREGIASRILRSRM